MSKIVGLFGGLKLETFRSNIQKFPIFCGILVADPAFSVIPCVMTVLRADSLCIATNAVLMVHTYTPSRNTFVLFIKHFGVYTSLGLLCLHWCDYNSLIMIVWFWGHALHIYLCTEPPISGARLRGILPLILLIRAPSEVSYTSCNLNAASETLTGSDGCWTFIEFQCVEFWVAAMSAMNVNI